ncbi:MAG: hypothetical protein ACLFO2_00635 [Candidatus Woesearchaeota archaeon]
MRYLDELKALDLPPDRYVVSGSGPLAVRGIRENRDIDLVLSAGLWEALKEDYPFNRNGGLQLSEHVEAFPRWPGVEKPWKLIERAEIIDGVPFALLEDVEAWKVRSSDSKDVEDVRLIRNYREGHG